jgi:hypothetical protein
MTRLPKIPLSPPQVPQQRLSEVVPLPQRPDSFNFVVGYGLPKSLVPKQGVPRSPELLVQVEWASSPMHYGVEAFYIQARRKYWLLWLRTLNDNCDPWKWTWLDVGGCDREGIEKQLAAIHLLLEYWRFHQDEKRAHLDSEPYDWINEEGLLSISDVRSIVRELNAKRAHDRRSA